MFLVSSFCLVSFNFLKIRLPNNLRFKFNKEITKNDQGGPEWFLSNLPNQKHWFHSGKQTAKSRKKTHGRESTGQTTGQTHSPPCPSVTAVHLESHLPRRLRGQVHLCKETSRVKAAGSTQQPRGQANQIHTSQLTYEVLRASGPVTVQPVHENYPSTNNWLPRWLKG